MRSMARRGAAAAGLELEEEEEEEGRAAAAAWAWRSSSGWKKGVKVGWIWGGRRAW